MPVFARDMCRCRIEVFKAICPEGRRQRSVPLRAFNVRPNGLIVSFFPTFPQIQPGSERGIEPARISRIIRWPRPPKVFKPSAKTEGRQLTPHEEKPGRASCQFKEAQASD